MRFIWAVVAFIVAAALIGAGIAQRTIFLGPNTQTAQVEVSKTAPYTLVDGEVLNFLPGSQRLLVQGEGTIFGAFGRSADMRAWLGDTTYNHATVKDGEVVTETVTPEVDPPEVSEAQQKQIDAATAAEIRTPSAATPIASDLWLEEFTGEGKITKSLSLPAGMSVLLATDGTAPAPTETSVTWRIDNSTPWAGPLIVLGVIALLIGLFLYVLGVRHMRRKRGPRRRGVPPLEETQPLNLEEARAEAKGVISSTRSKRGRRSFIAIPVVTIAAVALSGCTPDAWPKADAPTATPTPTPTVVVPEDQAAPAVTESQAERILTQIAQTVAVADEQKSADIAATRLAGTALAERITNYTLRGKIEDQAALDPIAPKPYQIILPQATDGWPRVIMAIWQDQTDSTNPPRIMTAVQDDPWGPYRLTYIGQMEAAAEVPDIAPAAIGALRVVPDSSLLTLAPDQLSAAYADIIDKGETSEYAQYFDIAGDAFLPKIAAGRTARQDAFAVTGKETGTLTFAAAASDTMPIALATLSSGAIVSVTVTEVDTTKPNNADAVIRLPKNPQVQALTGVTESATGFTTTYIDQLYFSVPAKGSGEQIKLIAYTSNILKSEVNK